jgi:hypothetical protein
MYLQTNAEFEPISLDSESNVSEDVAKLIIEDRKSIIDVSSNDVFPEEDEKSTSTAMKKFRRVRFNMLREVRRLPERIALEAKMARLPYRERPLDCHEIFCGTSQNALIVSYLVYFAPLVNLHQFWRRTNSFIIYVISFII